MRRLLIVLALVLVPGWAAAQTCYLCYHPPSGTVALTSGVYTLIDDEDTPLTARTTLNFEGAGVTCADDTDQTTCTIAGGSFASPGAGIIVDTVGDGTLAARTLTAGTGISVANGPGAAGNPTVSVDTATTPQYSSGTGSPPGTCNVGEVYFETDQLRACSCSTANTWTCNGKLRAHATDCTALTDGLADEMCFERDADTVYVCEPSAGGCDTAGEWKQVAGGSGAPTDAEYIVAEANGSLSAEVAPSAANQVPMSSSSTAAAWQTIGGGLPAVPRPIIKRWTYCGIHGHTGGASTWGCLGAFGADNSGDSMGSVAISDDDGPLWYVRTTASSGNGAYFSSYGQPSRSGRSLRIQGYAKLEATTSERVWLGLTEDVAASRDADDPTIDHVGFRYSTNASDTNWKCVTNDGGVGGTVNDSGVAASTTSFLWEIVETNATDFKFYINGALVCTNSTNLPVTSTNIGFVGVITTLTTATKELRLGYIYSEASN